MSISRRTILPAIVAGALIALSSAGNCRAQDDDEAGGYVPVRANDANVAAAGNFAVRERARTSGTAVRLVEIKSARQQVVAGMNYELCIEVGVRPRGESEEVYFVTAVVYQNIRKAYSLTSWTESDCGAD